MPALKCFQSKKVQSSYSKDNSTNHFCTKAQSAKDNFKNELFSVACVVEGDFASTPNSKMITVKG